MGWKRTCKRYSSVKTKRSSAELRCVSYSKRKGKAICAPGIKGPARSPGLIHERVCHRDARKRK